MFIDKLRYYNTIAMIEYSDKYLDNYYLFRRGIRILKKKVNNDDFSDFTEEEREVLEEIFNIMGL